MNEILLDRPQPRPAASVLDEALLDRIGGRAAAYDRDAAFFHEDLRELRDAGYLKAWVPVEKGGLGHGLPDIVRDQARLGGRALATALALNMHLYWVGTAVHLWRRGDHSLDWILDEAAAGKIFAAGHGEIGNDLGLAHSFVKAEPLADGAYRFTGRKIFTSLSPVWDWLGLHGLDDSNPQAPRIVHAFISRKSPGIRVEETWDALGARATRSDDTVLDGVVADAAHVARILPAGPPADPFADGILSSALPGIAAVYHGAARRAFDLAVENAAHRTSAALGGRTYAHHPAVQGTIARAAILLDSIEALNDRVAQDWWNGVDHGSRWPAKFLAAKQYAVDTAREVVDLATKAAGAGSLFRRNELERIYRDVRSGPFHPPNTDAVHDVVGQTYLGVLGQPPAAAVQ